MSRQGGSFKGTYDGKPFEGHGHVDRTGYRLGAGVEYALSRHVFAKAEYHFTRVENHGRLEQSQIATGFGVRY
jgi:outer membrane immunogenic protein